MSNYIMHHGIKGQRWGVRRFENPDGTLTDAGKRRYRDAISSRVDAARNKVRQTREDIQRAKYEKRRNAALTSKKAKVVLKNADTLSDKELREKLNRLQMEQNLRDLDSKNTAWGVRFMKDMGNQAAKQAVGAIIITPAILAIKAALK